ncbi:3-methyl-2-oxobutanoate hydroxymethyltransferase [Brachybacterium endophyticum]|nr:3-methyl-2-oxobutanoate hydroxymethyltransferase [Brachybacterium endophyticum]
MNTAAVPMPPERSHRPAKVRLRHLQEAKDAGRSFSMLTSYDALSARVFEEAGIDVLLAGDSAGTTVLGFESTVHTTHQDIVTFTAAVARSVSRPLVVADLAFGSYQVDVAEAVRNGVELLRAGAEAVKLEGGAARSETVRALVDAGIPVMGHLGFTPQSVNVLSGHRVQGRDHAAADRLAEDAQALQEAGAFAVVLELLPSEVSGRITEFLEIPTIGIGAGPDCDGQVLVWQDMAGLSGFEGRFVRRFADLRGELLRAATEYREAVETKEYPTAEHSFE